MMRATPQSWLLLAAGLVSGCEQEPVKATQVIFTLRSDLGSELSTIQASVFDAQGEKPGDEWTFTLAERPLPFSLTVVPTLKSTPDFMLVISGKDADGNPLIENKTSVRFVQRETIGVELWLSKQCLGKVCGAAETCNVASDVGAECAPIPWREGKPTKAGEELGGSVVTERTPTTTDDGSVAAIPHEGGSIGSGPDAGSSTSVDSGAVDAETVDAGTSAPVNTTGVCVGSAGQAVCTDSVMSVCDSSGQSERQETCASARQCQLGLASKACAPCNPGARRCMGVRLERCTEDGSKWELFKTCESEALCNAVAGDCVAGTCTATTRVCMGNDLYGCSQDLTQLTRLRTCNPNLCDQMNGECDMCSPSSRVCNGNMVEACDGQGQNLTRTACPSATPKCTGSGQCVQCTVPADCPAPSAVCQTATCNASTARCGMTPTAAHQACSGGVCNGSGSCVQCVDDTDCRSNLGAPKCSNNRCVACLTNADCAATFECTANRTCQRISLAGTGASCLSYAAASGSTCGSYYCGVTSDRLTRAIPPGAACSASTACSPALVSASRTCSGMYLADAISDPQGFRTKVTNCVNASSAAVGVSSACVACYLNVDFCCTADTLGCALTCSGGASSECDAALKSAGCVAPLFTCTGLPNPL